MELFKRKNNLLKDKLEQQERELQQLRSPQSISTPQVPTHTFNQCLPNESHKWQGFEYKVEQVDGEKGTSLTTQAFVCLKCGQIFIIK